MIKKADIILAAVLLVVCLASSLLVAGGGSAGATVTVKIDDKVYGTYSLAENQDIVVKQNKHKNVLSIKDGSVSMVKSDCKNQLCVEQGAISRDKQIIVCLPNHVTVSIEGMEDSGIDTVAF